MIFVVQKPWQVSMYIRVIYGRFSAAVAQSAIAFASHAEGGCSTLSRDRPKTQKQVVKAPLLNARQQC